MDNLVQEDPNQLLEEMENLLGDDDNVSHSTGNGSTLGSRVTNYSQVDDKSIFQA